MRRGGSVRLQDVGKGDSRKCVGVVLSSTERGSGARPSVITPRAYNLAFISLVLMVLSVSFVGPFSTVVMCGVCLATHIGVAWWWW